MGYGIYSASIESTFAYAGPVPRQSSNAYVAYVAAA